MNVETEHKEQLENAGKPNTNNHYGHPAADNIKGQAEPFVTAPEVKHKETHVGEIPGLQASRQLPGSPADAPLPVVKKAHES